MKYMNRSIFGVVIGGINIFGFVCTIIYIIVVLIKLGNEDGKDYKKIHCSLVQRPINMNTFY